MQRRRNVARARKILNGDPGHQLVPPGDDEGEAPCYPTTILFFQTNYLPLYP
jgi:hypothetical protein